LAPAIFPHADRCLYLGLAVLGETPAGAQPLGAQKTSVQAWVDSFVLKSAMNEALTAATRLARENKDSLASALISRQAAASSWASIERHAHVPLDWIEAWMRNQSSSNQYPGTPV